MEKQQPLFPTSSDIPSKTKEFQAAHKAFVPHVEIHEVNDKIFLGEPNGNDFQGLAYLTKRDLRILVHMVEAGRFKKIL